jgi:hypothetical protein
MKKRKGIRHLAGRNSRWARGRLHRNNKVTFTRKIKGERKMELKLGTANTSFTVNFPLLAEELGENLESFIIECNEREMRIIEGGELKKRLEGLKDKYSFPGRYSFPGTIERILDHFDEWQASGDSGYESGEASNIWRQRYADEIDRFETRSMDAFVEWVQNYG